MRNLKAMLIVLLALLWLPASMHCRLETLPGFDFLACASAASASEAGHQESDCTGDACADLESGDWRQPEVTQLPAAPECLAEVLRADLNQELAQVYLPAEQVASLPPPELSQVWRFHSRAALPVRAPSLAS